MFKKNVNESDVRKALGAVKDPELGRDLVSLGMIKDIQIRDSAVSFTLELTTPACPLKSELRKAAEEVVRAIPGVREVGVNLSSRVPKASGLPERWRRVQKRV